ncbi:MAG: cbb3-type cytochrome c oxidase subunit 3 [Sulfuricellaceae bacterium]|nr:cbb3-type cytochrome c oxidase subunit 3 [Sulfuricellaceae bacterium]
MDINDLRSIMTVIFFALFVGIVIWAFSPSRKKEFDEAARLVMDNDEPDSVIVKPATKAAGH